MPYDTLDVAIGADRIGIITLSRPAARNAMSTRMMEELRGLLRGLLRQPRRRRLPDPDGRGRRLLRGRRPQGAQGHDRTRSGAASTPSWSRWCARIMDCPVPVIAAVNGAAYRRRHGAGAGVRLHLRGAVGPLRPDRGDARHHAGRGRHAEPAARGGRAARQGDRADRRAVLGRGGAGLGHGQQGLRRTSRCSTRRCAVALRIAANAPISVRQAKKALDKATELDRMSGYAFEIEAYNRTVVDRGPPGRHQRLQREAQAAVTRGG